MGLGDRALGLDGTRRQLRTAGWECSLRTSRLGSRSQGHFSGWCSAPTTPDLPFRHRQSCGHISPAQHKQGTAPGPSHQQSREELSASFRSGNTHKYGVEISSGDSRAARQSRAAPGTAIAMAPVSSSALFHTSHCSERSFFKQQLLKAEQ